MDIHQHKSANRRKVVFLTLILPLSLLVILGLAARPGSAESEEAFTTYLPNVSFYSFSGPHPMLAAASSDDVGNPVPPVIESITTVPINPLVSVNETIQFTMVFTDPEAIDSFTVAWDWGDGSTTTQSDVFSPIQASHTYTDPSIYTVGVTVINSFDLEDTESFEYVVVYDPSGGFVTGGGWIDSPQGAYMPDPALTGRATFGFVSKYRKGADTPTGNTEFQFQVADLNFHSSRYEWLVVNRGGHRAQFKGEGTINGIEGYRFMIWASDEDPDRFRIKIWEEPEESVEVIIYDNGSVQAIGGGSIVIHAK